MKKKNKQLEHATLLLELLQEDFVKLSELDPLAILDMMGVAGLAFVEGSEASEAFLDAIKEQVMSGKDK